MANSAPAKLCGIFYWEDGEEHIRLHCPAKAQFYAILRSEEEGEFKTYACHPCLIRLGDHVLYMEELKEEHHQ